MDRQRQIIHNSIRTPDGTVLTSRSAHDYKLYVDKNGYEYMVDGGHSYLRHNLVPEAPYEELTLYTDDPHNQIREVFTWGTYGKKGDQPITRKALKDLDYDHVKAIIETQKQLSTHIAQLFKNEIEFRDTRI